MSVRAKRGGDHVGANPVDRGKPGSKLHLVCDDSGLPLTAAVTAANVNDTNLLPALLDDVPPVRTPSGRRRTRPARVYADKGYDSRTNRSYLRRRGIRPRIARRRVESSTRSATWSDGSARSSTSSPPPTPLTGLACTNNSASTCSTSQQSASCWPALTFVGISRVSEGATRTLSPRLVVAGEIDLAA
jgi:Transposase DDE domain